MVARVETHWIGTNATALQIAYPLPGAYQDIAIAATWETAATLATEIAARVQAKVGGVWTCVFDTTSRKYVLSVAAGTFNALVGVPLATFTGWSTTAYLAVVQISSTLQHPPSIYYSAAPLPDPDPEYRFSRVAASSDCGRVEGAAADFHAMLAARLFWAADIDGSTWDNLRAWLETYGLRGNRFTLFRSTTTARYSRMFSTGFSVPTGTSVCVLDEGGQTLSRAWLGGGAGQVEGSVDLSVRCLEGY